MVFRKPPSLRSSKPPSPSGGLEEEVDLSGCWQGAGCLMLGCVDATTQPVAHFLTGSNPAQPKCGTKSWASQLHLQARRFQGYQAVLGLVCPCSPRSWRQPPRLRGHACFVALFAGCPPGWGHLPGCLPPKTGALLSPGVAARLGAAARWG